MKGKGIAIQTILLLLVGILVVGIIVYMVYRYFVGAPLSEQECRSRAITWCTGCKNSNVGVTGAWTVAGSAPGSDLASCAGTYFGGAPANCVGTQGWCGAFIPV